MNYSAHKIYLTCNEGPLAAWAAFMRGHIEEVSESLRQERVRHEMWFSGQDQGGLFIIGVMDVDDHQASAAAANVLVLEVDRVHREFKKHWDRARTHKLDIAPRQAPVFDGYALLFEARP